MEPQDPIRDPSKDPRKDPKKDPDDARSRDEGQDGRPAGPADRGASAPGWMTAPEDFTPQPHDPATGQVPPWQVPKPELRDTGAGQVPTPGPGPLPGPIFDPFEREREREAAARKKRSQRRTVVVGLGVTALLAGTITAIVASNEAEADYAQVCFNDETGERVEDTRCDNSSSAGRSSGIYAWYFYSRGSNVPAVGQNRSQYPSFTKTVPQGAKTSTGYSTKGGTVSRGGFGSSSKGGSTGG